MSQQSIASAKPAFVTMAVLAAVACMGLTACGSSSSKSTTGATKTSATSGRRPGAARFAAVRECLQKNGIKLPTRPTGQRRPGGRPGGGFLSGGPRLPKGVTRAQYEAAFRKCGGLPGRGRFAGAGRYSSPAAKQAFTKFAACMRQNGVNVPTPNTSGKGPIFSAKGIDTSSATFRKAESKCRGDLSSAFKARPGAGAAGGEGPPPSPGQP